MEHTKAWAVANGNEIHDRRTEYDASGARIGETANRIAKLEYPYRDSHGQADNAARIVRAVNSHDDMLAALKGLESYMRDLSSQTDTSAIDNLEKLRRGHCRQYDQARAAIARAEGRE